ncbi:hypothetical protein D9M72_480870 [compost metagenome]
MAGPGDGCVEAGVEGNPGFGVVLGGHGGHDIPQAFQLFGRPAFGGQAGGRDFDVRAGLGEVQGRVLTEDQVLGYPVGHHKRAAAGLGGGEAEGVAGAQRFTDHGTAHPVLLGERGFGAQFGADLELAGLDIGAEDVEDGFGCAKAGEGLSCCPAV